MIVAKAFWGLLGYSRSLLGCAVWSLVPVWWLMDGAGWLLRCTWQMLVVSRWIVGCSLWL